MSSRIIAGEQIEVKLFFDGHTLALFENGVKEVRIKDIKIGHRQKTVHPQAIECRLVCADLLKANIIPGLIDHDPITGLKKQEARIAQNAHFFVRQSPVTMLYVPMQQRPVEHTGNTV